MSSARKSRWSLKTSQLKDDSAKAVLLISLSSEVLPAINKGCRLGQQGYVLVNVHLKILTWQTGFTGIKMGMVKLLVVQTLTAETPVSEARICTDS